MLIFAILVVGFSGLIAQVLLLRELLVSFFGNELTVGIILANWVFLEAMGAILLGRLIDRIRRRLLVFGILNIIFALSLILCVYLTRTFKVILNVPPGLGLGIDYIFWSSFLILLPVSFVHGGLFISCVKIFASSTKYAAGQAVGQVYFWETVGTIAAGVVFTYLFIPHLDSFVICFILLILNLLMLWFLYLLRFKGRRTNLIKAAGAISIASLFFFCLPLSESLQDRSIKSQWQDQQVLDYANSIYGNVAVTRRQEQYTFFVDGLPLITTPYPDVIFVQEFAQIPLLFHPRPQDILIISGGAGGLINEILNNSGVSRIDYVELDPLILKMLRRYPTELTNRELNDPRVKVVNLDGRFFIKNTDAKYDLIFLGLGSPTDLQTNRLFTEEFFQEALRRLEPEGILTFTLSGSLAYIGPEVRDLNACILNSLKNVFPYVRVIPGDFNLFLASAAPQIVEVNSGLISQRIKQRQLSSQLLLPAYVEYRLSPRWIDWFNDSLSSATTRSNRDFSSFALFKTLSLWNAQFSPGWQKVFLGLERVNLGVIIGFLFGFFLISLLFIRGKRKHSLVLPYVILSSGFFGMLTNLIIIFAFQIVYGYLYYQIAMLITLFMAGAALGSILISRSLERIKQLSKLLIGLETGAALWIFITLYVILTYPSHLTFFLLCAITGFLVGAEFPLANKIYLKRRAGLGQAVGILYAADLFGGWFAAVFSGILFLSILGLVNTVLVIFALKLISLIFLLGTVLAPIGERC